MPSVSKKQHNFMAAIAKNPAFAKKVGIKQNVGEEFLSADKGKKFKEGGMTHDDILEDKKLIKKAFKMHDKQEHKGEHTNLTKLKKGGDMKMCKGGKAMKYAKGGMVEKMGPKTMKEDVEKGSNKLLKFGESAVQKRGHTKGKNLGDSGPTAKIQKMCKGGMAKGGMASKRADGIVSKGKTKGKFC